MADSIYAVLPTASLQEAILALDKSRRGCVLVCNPDGTFLDILTDGDLRRAYLAHVPLTASVQDIRLQSKHNTPLSLPADTGEHEIQEAMKANAIRHLPLLRVDGIPLAVAVTTAQFGGVGLVPAVVMCGGRGERLMPLTANTPKPLLPIGDKSILDHILDGMAEAGIAEVCLATGYLADQFKDIAHPGMLIDIVTEQEPLGTAGALYKHMDSVKHWPLLVVNGDLLTSIDYGAMVAYHREHKAVLTMAVRKIEAKIPYGVVEATEYGYVWHLAEKPNHGWFVNAGIYLLEKEALGWLPPYKCDMTDLVNTLLDQDGPEGVGNIMPVAAFPIWEAWRDIGTLEAYKEANHDTVC